MSIVLNLFPNISEICQDFHVTLYLRAAGANYCHIFIENLTVIYASKVIRDEIVLEAICLAKTYLHINVQYLYTYVYN